MVLESKKQSYGFRMGLALFRLQCPLFFMSKVVGWQISCLRCLTDGLCEDGPWPASVSPLGVWKWEVYPQMIILYIESIARDSESNDDWPVDLGMRYHSQFSDKNHCHNSWFLWHEAGIKDFSYIVPACIHKRASWLLLAASRTKMQETWPGSGSPGWLGHPGS